MNTVDLLIKIKNERESKVSFIDNKITKHYVATNRIVSLAKLNRIIIVSKKTLSIMIKSLGTMCIH